MHNVKVNDKNHRGTFKCKKLLVFLALCVCFFSYDCSIMSPRSVYSHLCLSPCWLSVIRSLLARPTRSSLTWHGHSQAVDYYLPHWPYQQADGMGSICLAAVSVCLCGVNRYTLIPTTNICRCIGYLYLVLMVGTFNFKFISHIALGKSM